MHFERVRRGSCLSRLDESPGARRPRWRRQLSRCGTGLTPLPLLLALALPTQPAAAEGTATPAAVGRRTGQGSSMPWKTIAYLGVRFDVPASWPVYDLARD